MHNAMMCVWEGNVTSYSLVMIKILIVNW
jgi:hypothetical protein